MKVVIADDSSSIRIKLSRFLKELGHEVVGEAENGYQALKLISETAPDLVTLDLVMPELDGLSTLRALRHENKKVLVVMISSAATLANETSAAKEGANFFLKKPFDREALKSCLEKVIREGQSGAAA
jgi:two-component system, chemotaxis family, chemotaxis protein CheY